MSKIARRRVLLSVVLVAVAGGVVLGLTATNGRSARNSAPPDVSRQSHAPNKRPPNSLTKKIRASGSSSCNYACTPPNQEALDADANDAQRIAGRSYYTGAAVHADTNTVDLYLADAPQSVIDQLQAEHPGIYVIHNDASHTSATLLKLEAGFDDAALHAQGIDVNEWGPTVDGYLQVGVTSDVATAKAMLDKIYGPNVIQVVKTEPIIADSLTAAPKRVGFLVGAIRVAGGPAGVRHLKGGGLATVFNSQGHAVAAERIRPGHDFRFRLVPGRYWLGFGRNGRQNRAGCPRGLVTVRAGRTAHGDLFIGCDWR